MNNKMLGGSLAGLGVLLIVVGLVLMLVIVPGMRVFPTDVDTTRVFNLSYLTLLDAESLEFGVWPEGGDHEIRVERNIKVLEATGDSTLIQETQTLLNGDDLIREQVKMHALDRSSMTPVDEFPEEWRSTEMFDTAFWEREGLVIGWGIGADPEDYDGWNDDTRDMTEMEYQETVEYNGIETHFFTSESGPDLIAPDHAAFLQLPPGLTTAQLATLASGLDVEGVDLSTRARLKLLSTIGQALEDVMGEDADAIPLEYYYDYVGEYWVEPTTGVLVNTTKYEHRAATFPEDIRARFAEILEESDQAPEDADYLPPDILDTLLPITVNQFYYELDPTSSEEAVDDAVESRDQLVLFGETVPIALIIAGVFLGGIGGFAYSRPSNKPTSE